MSGTTDIHLVVLLDNELRDLARAYKALMDTKPDTPEEEVTRTITAVLQVGIQTLKHLIVNPDAPFVILGSRGKL